VSAGVAKVVAAAGVVEAAAVEPAGGGAVVATVVPAAAAAAAIEANTAVKLGAVEPGELEADVVGDATGVAILNGACGLWATRVSDMSEGAMRNPFDLFCDLLRS
jgi:hypothetical protein